MYREVLVRDEDSQGKSIVIVNGVYYTGRVN